MILEKISGPIIGALIGYFTNYIAVKMLFYPKKEIKIWGRKVPFTPGAIPKGQPRLAKAIGNIVTTTLISEEDITKKMLSEETEKVVADKVIQLLSENIRDDAVNILSSEEKYNAIKGSVSEQISEQIVAALKNIEIGRIVVREGEQIIKEKVEGTMLKMFLTDELISSFIQPMESEITKLVDERGKEYITPVILSKLRDMEQQSLLDVCREVGIEENELRTMIISLYHKMIENTLPDLIKQLNLQKLIEDKVNGMNIDELEQLVLSIMKKELDTIVNLGAVVGAILGILNIFI